MFTAIFNVLPDWAVAVILAALVWFGVNYAWLSPAYFERVVSATDGCSNSHASRKLGDERVSMALYTSTLGILESESSILYRLCKD